MEKPRKLLNSYMGTGNCVFRNGILDFIPFTPVNPIRGERELPDLIQCVVDEGNSVKLFLVGSHYVMLETAHLICTQHLHIEEVDISYRYSNSSLDFRVIRNCLGMCAKILFKK